MSTYASILTGLFFLFPKSFHSAKQQSNRKATWLKQSILTPSLISESQYLGSPGDHHTYAALPPTSVLGPTRFACSGLLSWCAQNEIDFKAIWIE